MKAENKIRTSQENEPLNLSSKFTSAVEYTRRIHTERRKGTEIPYMAHLLGVAAFVMGEAGHAWIPITEDMVIAALLHDAAEDHGGEERLKDIEHNFGSEVARMVGGLSDSLAADADKKLPWEQRKEAYIQRLKYEPADVRIISVADKLYNAKAILDDYEEIGPLIWKRFKRGREEQLWYFDKLLAVYKTFPAIRIVGEFDRVLTALRDRSSAEVN